MTDKERQLREIKERIRPKTDIDAEWRFQVTDLIDILIDDEQDNGTEPERTGWFTARLGTLRRRRELREDGRIYSQSGVVTGCPLSDYTDIEWEDDKPTVDRSLRGWVLVTDADGRKEVRWASEKGVSIAKARGYTWEWELINASEWTVEPFPTGYTEDEIRRVLDDCFEEDWDDKLQDAGWPGIGRVIVKLRRLRREA